jgi:hypothetical protein
MRGGCAIGAGAEAAGSSSTMALSTGLLTRGTDTKSGFEAVGIEPRGLGEVNTSSLCPEKVWLWGGALGLTTVSWLVLAGHLSVDEPL